MKTKAPSSKDSTGIGKVIDLYESDASIELWRSLAKEQAMALNRYRSIVESLSNINKAQTLVILTMSIICFALLLI